jgi:hypothetical protein
VAVPLIHAQVEVFQSAREFEATHSELCPRIHAEATCVVCSSFQLTPAAGATASARPAENPAAGSAAGRESPSRPARSSHPVRAPPLPGA